MSGELLEDLATSFRGLLALGAMYEAGADTPDLQDLSDDLEIAFEEDSEVWWGDW